MTLYTFDRDTMGSGKSVCNGPCATNWPPLMASASDKRFGRMDRRHARRRQPAMGLPRQAAVLLGQGHQGRRPHRRRLQQRLAPGRPEPGTGFG
jgi:hypothetical protein